MTSKPDRTAPVVESAPAMTPGATAAFILRANEPGVAFQCQLARKNTVTQRWTRCSSLARYSWLTPVTYVLSVRGTDPSGNTSAVSTFHWTVGKVWHR